MANVAMPQCGKCHERFDGVRPAIKVTRCQHEFHRDCFLSGPHIQTVNNVVQAAMCPETGCGQHITRRPRGNRAPVDINTKIEEIRFPQLQPPVRPPVTPSQTQTAQQGERKETRGLKYVTYLAVALLCITIAGVIWPSLIALGIGAAAAVPIGYLLGRKIEQYHASSSG